MNAVARSSSRQFGHNALAGLGFLVLQGAVSLWFTPYLIGHLGIETYGLIPLSASIVNYMSIFSVGLQMSMGRHLTVSRWQDGGTEASRVLSNALFMSVGIGTLTVAATVPIAANAGSIFGLSASLVPSAQVFMMLNSVYFAVTLVAACFGSVGYAHGRVDYQNAIRVLDLLIRTLIPVAAFSLGRVSLGWVGTGLLLASFWSLLASVIMWRRVAPGIHLRVREVEIPMLRRLGHTSLWGTVNQAGTLLHLSTDVIVLTVLAGTADAGTFGALTLWIVFIRSAVAAIAAGAGPLVTRSLAEGDSSRAWVATGSLIRVCGACAAVSSGILLACPQQLITLWLGAEFASAWPILFVLTLALPVNLAVVPLFTVQTATDRVRGPALATLGTGLLNLVISVALVGLKPIGVGVALGTFVALSAKNLIYTPLHGARLVGRRPRDVYVLLLPVVSITLVSFAAMRLSMGLLVRMGLVGLLLGALFALIASLPVVWYHGLDKPSRDIALRLLRGQDRRVTT